MIKVKGKDVELKMDWFAMTNLEKEHGLVPSKLGGLQDSLVMQTNVLMACLPKGMNVTFDEACEIFNENGPVKVLSEIAKAMETFYGPDLSGEMKA